MRWWWRFLAVAVMGSPAAAQDMSYGWCETKGRDGNYLMSALMQKLKGQHVELYEEAFLAGVGSSGRPSCWFFYATPREAKSHFEQRQDVIKTQEKVSYQLTGWTGPYGISGEPPAKPSGAFLTVEDTTPKEPVEDDVLKAQRDGAAAIAKRIADAARRDAAIQAQFEKFMADLRKRGSAQ